jgi:hypothetical protein
MRDRDHRALWHCFWCLTESLVAVSPGRGDVRQRRRRLTSRRVRALGQPDDDIGGEGFDRLIFERFRPSCRPRRPGMRRIRWISWFLPRSE